MVVEPDLKKRKLHTKPTPINQIKSIITPEERDQYFITENEKVEDEYVIDVYKLDNNVVDDELLHDHPNLYSFIFYLFQFFFNWFLYFFELRYFLESGEDNLYTGPEYDSDESEDENGLVIFLIKVETVSLTPSLAENYYGNDYPDEEDGEDRLTSDYENYSSDDLGDVAYHSDYDDFEELDY